MESIQFFFDFYLFTICFVGEIKLCKDFLSRFQMCVTHDGPDVTQRSDSGHKFPATLDCPDFLQLTFFDGKKTFCDALHHWPL